MQVHVEVVEASPAGLPEGRCGDHVQDLACQRCRVVVSSTGRFGPGQDKGGSRPSRAPNGGVLRGCPSMSPSLLMLTEAQGGFGQVEMELRGVETEPACLFSGRVGSQLVLGVRAGLPITAAIAARLCTAPNRPTTPAE